MKGPNGLIVFFRKFTNPPAPPPMIADLKFALRQLAKSPGFAVVAVLTLALGIGANTAIFSIVNAVLLEPLPYPHSDRLVQICEMPSPGAYIPIASGGAFIDWQDQSTQLESLSAAHSEDENLTGAGDPVRLPGLQVSADYLRVFGIAPALGRDFLPIEDAANGNHDVVIISDELWKAHFGGDPGIVGKLIHLDGASLTVIGVLAPHALFGNDAAFLTPSVIRPSGHKTNRDYNYVVSVVGRLKPGATAAKAAEELSVSKLAVRSLYPVFKQKWTVGMMSLHEQIFGDMRPYVLTLLAAVAVVLLIACANVANLLLARATVRQSEIAVRVALGASTWRIVRQLLTESLLLALAGGVAGLLLGVVAINPLVVFVGIRETAGNAIGINARILAFTLGASCLTGILFGILPALSAARPDLNGQLKEGARGSTVGSHRRMQALLLVSETALTVLLLVCAGLLLRSFVKAMNADTGFKTDNVLVFDVSVPNSKAPSTADKVRLGQRIIERLTQIPGATRVGMASSVPMNGGNGLGDLISREDRPLTRNDYSAGFDSVAGDFFQAMEIPLLSGRFLTRQDDTEKAPKVMVINDVLASTLFGKENPLGQLLHFKGDTWQIVGVVGSVRRYQLDYGSTPSVYFAQTYFPWRTTVVVHTSVPPLTLAREINRALADVDPDLPIANMRPLAQSVESTLQTRRIVLVLLGIFALTALVLACVGIYGVISYSVAQRTREIGIRIALGAGSRQVVSLILRQSLRLVLLGLGLGIAASLGAGLLIANQLFDVSKADPQVMLAV
ncbi:MAG TPA: ABC transporter permease, partial [Opitutaceae bacterium]